MWLAGSTTAEIAVACGVSDRSVRNWLAGMDVGYSHSESARRRWSRDRQQRATFQAHLDAIAAGPDGQLTAAELAELDTHRQLTA